MPQISAFSLEWMKYKSLNWQWQRQNQRQENGGEKAGESERSVGFFFLDFKQKREKKKTLSSASISGAQGLVYAKGPVGVL